MLPVISKWAPVLAAGIAPDEIHAAFVLIYLSSAATVVLQNPHRFAGLVRGLRRSVTSAPAEGALCADEIKTPHCAACKWRLAAQESGAMAQTAARN